MDGDLRGTIKPGRYDRAARPHRRVTRHVVILPGACAKPPRQYGIQADRDMTRKADLAAMCVTAEHQIELGMGGLLINLWRVR